MFNAPLPIFFFNSIGGLYEINLDRRKLKTPGGKLFTVPNEALAIAVATEWDAQRETLKFYTMHLVCDLKFGLDGLKYEFLVTLMACVLPKVSLNIIVS